ncbi:MAG: beta-ketoacyl-[acyl-carrier-protein] synthase II [Bacteroidetes bacterium GWE2_39_28]|nr:MAG: beta-ketoacyl-[acyl-carrier-protein] synthase II [Bacteroidetes bacterium GWE2_39_28]OFY12508.1 MAG: beta-ketoacyl-[acyl-carrier-protein] synthase II [Bacteroidetes bacterium GWF2_39_10]OFZ07247.1 MAG: beta-ketoacyl-[acyl-carrier-protein] synthase II [Bacteroidetes bacterium RIFOXYB2_FULL_39_7]OFZ10633.1 MAG: beta-ketoacyl-[acyl-carrier-protein] synthase II [Bacteroidetes bacterium RIFOXYC2_FULL_39_11]HCT93459.1 beta-ketoacyl-[acyl-carrier-protein] synthase II [Rikenellaceae bacterium]
MKLKRVVVTGIGTINPIGNNIAEYFDNLDKGLSGADLITRFDTTLFKTKFACELKDYDPAKYGIDKKEERKLDRFTQYAFIATGEAMADSSLDLEKVNPDKAGVILGTGIGGIDTLFQEVMGYFEGGCVPRFSPFLIPKMIPDIAPGMISMKYGFRGPNYTTVSACASSTHAMIDAFNTIRMGKADIIITGGSEAGITIPSIGGFNSSQALSTNNENYKTASRPFDKTRDGFVMGEGAAILIFEEYDHAVARGAKIYCEIGGGGMTADAYHITAPHPEGFGAMNVMKVALEDGDIQKEEVDYINVHGTATPLGDIAELKAIKSLFGEHAYKINISATKSMTGHLLGATGAVEALACIHAITSGTVPPTINFETEDPEIDYKLNLTLNKAQKREVNVAMNNTFGFGGHNSCIVFKKVK